MTDLRCDSNLSLAWCRIPVVETMIDVMTEMVEMMELVADVVVELAEEVAVVLEMVVVLEVAIGVAEQEGVVETVVAVGVGVPMEFLLAVRLNRYPFVFYLEI